MLTGYIAKILKKWLTFNIDAVCAYLTPKNIPKQFLLTWVKKNYPNIKAPEIVLDKILGTLRKYSMISGDINFISLHRLVQSILRLEHCSKIARNFDISYPPISLERFHKILLIAHYEFMHPLNSRVNIERQQFLLPHLQSLIENYNSLWPKGNKASYLIIAKIFKDIGFILDNLFGDPLSARYYYAKALNLQQKIYDRKDPRNVNILNIIGKIYIKISNVSKAMKSFDLTLKIQKQNPNTNKIEQANTFKYLGECYRQFGNPKTGKIWLEKALNIEKLFYKKDNLAIINTEEILFHIHRNLGNFSNAIKL